MRVSFDLDDTLVCAPPTPAEPPERWWRRRRYPERLREGTGRLLRELARRGCTVWIYASSGRPVRYVRGWLRGLGVPIEGVVNAEDHIRVVGRQGPSKYPPASGIDLHIDNAPGVGLEGRRHGFAVLVVEPEDRDWAARVLAAVEARREEIDRLRR